MGDTVDAVVGSFRALYSVELGEELYQRAKLRFAGQRQVTILQGDSSKILPELLSRIDDPCLFWLDGHYSEGDTARGEKETPIQEELCGILSHPNENHVVLIDDARCFIGQNDYPTLEVVRRLVLSKRKNW